MQYDIERILLEIESLPDWDEQITLQGLPGNKDANQGCGKTWEISHKEKEYLEPIFDLPYTNSIIKELGLRRTRLMRLKPKTCYTWHFDMTSRVHLALITNPYAKFVLEDKVFHIPADGNPVHIDTTEFHTAFNGHKDNDRIHLVGIKYDEEEEN